jgi:hypothetical protein
MRLHRRLPQRPWLLLSIPLVACAVWWATATTTAQDTVTGAFEGIVRNSSTGVVIPRATVQFINQGTGVTITKRSDVRGYFYQGLLPPGTYTIRVSAPGFETKDTVMRLLGLRTGEVVPVPVALDPLAPGATAAATPPTTATPQPGSSPGPGPTPTPTPGATPSPAATPALTAADTEIRGGINTSDARRDGAFVEEEVANLPLGGTTLTRTFDELALLVPGVAPPPQTLGGGVAGPGVGAGVGTSGQFAVNGLRSRANNFTVDGSDNNDEDIGVRRQGFLALVPQPIESVREYQIITALPPAQFGRNIGAQVNAISKSGTSATHGALYGFFNSSQLNARNFFDSDRGGTFALRSGDQPVIAASDFDFNDATLNFVPINGRPVMVTNEAGGEDSFTLGQGGLVLGGPLVPDRLFYFVSAEGHILNATRELSFAVPTVAERGVFRSGAVGIFLDPFTDMPEFSTPTTAGGDAVFSLFPFPNDPEGPYGENTYTRVLPASGQGKILSGKFDGNFDLAGRAQSVTGRYNFTDDWREIPLTGGAIFSTLRPRVRTQNFSFFLNSELSAPDSDRLVFNQVRLSYGRTRLKFEEVRDTQFLLPSDNYADTPFLLNAPLLRNVTLPNVVNNRIVANTGPVLYQTGGTVESAQVNALETTLGPVGQVRIAGFSPVGVDVFNFPQARVNNTYQFADELTLRAGRHRLTFGTDNRRTELNSDLPRNFRPLITFQGAPELDIDDDDNLFFTEQFIRPADLAAASAASGFFQTLTAGEDAAINLRFYQFNFYGQDQWRVRPDLSLSFGLRYEYNTPAREVNRRVEDSFDDPALSLVPGLARFIEGRGRTYDPDRNNFAPRVGLAYSPNLFGADRTTVVRAGYGLFYDQILGAVVSQSRSVFPRFLTVNLAGGVGNVLFDPDNLDPFTALGLLNPATAANLVDPTSLNRRSTALTLAEQIALINCIASAGGANCGQFFGGNLGDFALPSASGVEVTLPARRLQMPNAQHYSVSFEQQLRPDLVVSAAYVGTQGRNLLRFTTPNLGTNAVLLPLAFAANAGGLDFQPSVFGVAVQPGTRIGADGFTEGRPEPGVGGVQIFETSGASRYDGLQLQARGRFQRSLQYQANYTFSKVTDDVSDVFDLAGASALPQNSLTREGERGPANFDVRHRFAYSLVFDFPAFRLRNAALRHLLGGVQFASTGQYHTGQPFTVNSIFDNNLDGNLTDRLNTTEGIVVTGDRRQPLVLATDDPNSLLALIGEDGSVPRNSFRAGSVLDLNLAAAKTFRLYEQHSFTFRVEVFNFINRANFGIPVRFLEAPGFGRATDTVTPGRRVQFNLRYNF